MFYALRPSTRLKACDLCDDYYRPVSPRQRFCSQKCAKRHDREMAVSRMKRLRGGVRVNALKRLPETGS